MISICIPLFMFDVRKLVNDLHDQLNQLNILGEIIVVDDKSDEPIKKINREICSLNRVKYIELERNLGRSKIRNYLAEQASFEYMLFIDCDAKVNNKYFLSNYINAIEKDTVVIGGLAYSQEIPEKSVMLRWIYGREREALPLMIRQSNPYKSFKTFNFLIPKNIFREVQFSEDFSGYGHEDTMFGYELKLRGVKVKHIDNPLIHDGLEETDIFLKKTQEGLDNLLFIYKRFKNKPDFIQSIKLLNTYRKIEKLRIEFAVTCLFKFSRKLLRKNLSSSHPKMKLFDLYKLGYLCSLEKN